MSIRIDTGQLVAVLTDLVHTAAEPEAGATAGVLLHATQGFRAGEPGRTTLLAGTSTTGHAVGHTYTWCTGVLWPTLWPVQDVKAVIAVLGPLAKQHKNHAVEIRSEDGSVVISEDADLFGGGLALTFGAGDLDKYPRHVWQVLTAPPASVQEAYDSEIPNLPRTDISPSMLVPFIKVGKRRGEVLKIYRYHQRKRVLIQIGDTYVGALTPKSWPDDDSDGTEPDADVYAPELPEVVSAAAI